MPSTMRLSITTLTLLMALSCSKRPAELSDKCKQTLDSDSFYFAVPEPEMQGQFDAIWKLDNFLTTSDDSGIQTIDFDCVVTVIPTNEKLEELRKILGDNFDETVRISSTHAEAAKCVTESKGIQFVEATGQLIRFKTTNQTWDLDMQKDKLSDWKFILFKRGKHPVIIPNVSLTFDKIDEYFGIENEASR
jgi:hypothetical protein